MARRVWVSSSLKQIMRIEKVGFQIYRGLSCKGIPILIDSCDSNHSNISFFSLIFYVRYCWRKCSGNNTIIRLAVFRESATGLEAYARDRPFTNGTMSPCHVRSIFSSGLSPPYLSSVFLERGRVSGGLTRNSQLLTILRFNSATGQSTAVTNNSFVG